MDTDHNVVKAGMGLVKGRKVRLVEDISNSVSNKKIHIFSNLKILIQTYRPLQMTVDFYFYNMAVDLEI